MHELSSTVELAKIREGMRSCGSDDRPIGMVDGLAPTGFRIGGVEYAGEAIARVADERVCRYLTSEQADRLRAPVAGERPTAPLVPRRGPAREAPGSDHERRYGRNWSETDTGGTSRTRGADRAAWQGLREELREGGDHARSR